VVRSVDCQTSLCYHKTNLYRWRRRTRMEYFKGDAPALTTPHLPGEVGPFRVPGCAAAAQSRVTYTMKASSYTQSCETGRILARGGRESGRHITHFSAAAWAASPAVCAAARAPTQTCGSSPLKRSHRPSASDATHAWAKNFIQRRADPWARPQNPQKSRLNIASTAEGFGPSSTTRRCAARRPSAWRSCRQIPQPQPRQAANHAPAPPRQQPHGLACLCLTKNGPATHAGCR
jgi:hypothetical protein